MTPHPTSTRPTSPSDRRYPTRTAGAGAHYSRATGSASLAWHLNSAASQPDLRAGSQPPTADVFDGYAALVTIVAPVTIAPTITRNPADDQVFAAVRAAQADLILFGEAHLRDLLRYQDIGIVTARDAVERIGATGKT